MTEEFWTTGLSLFGSTIFPSLTEECAPISTVT